MSSGKKLKVERNREPKLINKWEGKKNGKEKKRGSGKK